MKRVFPIFVLLWITTTAFSATWFVRAGGGNRFSTNVPFGMCTGAADVDYPGTTNNLWSFSQIVALNYAIVDSNGDYEKITTAGTTGVQASIPTWPAHGSSGVTTTDGSATWTSQGAAPFNQACAVNEFPYLWSDNSGSGGAGTWIIAGGDTVVVRNCKVQAYQLNPSGTNCRVGYEGNVNGALPYSWCPGVGFSDCIMPPIPVGTAGAHTRILGQCAFGTYTCTPINDHYPFGTTNETQLFGGFTLNGVLNLQSTQYVDVIGFEITGHTGNCTVHGSPPSSINCPTSPPVGDFANIGILTNNTTANVTLQDVYVHGITSDGMFGPIGGDFTMTRVFVGFNGFVGWSLDDGADTPNAAGSRILASYVTMMGNGCYEEYPIVHTAFPARACYDTNSSGFGDGWSGQDGVLDTFFCDHCNLLYNTKDGYIGPHTQILHSRITNSFAYGNMGAAWKWGEAINGDILFQNNLTVANPWRMAEALPGAAQNFNLSTGLPGSYLSNFNRGNAGMAVLTRTGSVNHYYGSTFIAAGVILFQYGCGFFSPGNIFNQETNCMSVPNVFQGNNVLGYTDPATGSGSPSAFYFVTDTPGTYTFTTAFFNNEFGLKAGTVDPCGPNNITCLDPLMVSEPAQVWPGSEAALDAFNAFGGTGNSFYPASLSPLIHAGTPIAGLTTDFYSIARPGTPSLGAVEPSGIVVPPIVINGVIVVSGNTKIP